MNKLIDLPVLKDVCLPWAFFYTDSISENSSLPLPLSPIDINEELRFYTQKRSIDQSSSNNDCSILSIVSFIPSSQPLSSQHKNQTLHTPFSFSPLTHEHLPHNERAERPRSLFARQPVECLHGFQRPPSEDDENREFQGISPPKPHSSPRQRSPLPSPNSNARDSRERYSLPLFLTHVGRL